MNFVGITASGDGIAPLEFVWWSPCNTSLSEKQQISATQQIPVPL